MSWYLPFAIAHRGAPQLAPENTIAALCMAKKKGAVAVECDIQLTKDHVPVILHDTTLSRTTNGQGWLSQHNFSAIESLSAGKWLSKKFPQEKIPTLQQWLETARALSLLLNLEIKARTEKQAKILSQIVCEHIQKYYDRKLPAPLISSSNIAVLQSIYKNNPRLQQGLIIEKPLLHEDSISTLKKINVVSIHQPYALMTADYIDALHQKKLRALAYTVNDKKLALRLKKDGVDGIFTDNHVLF